MKTVLWVILGFVGTTVVTALGARLSVGQVLPDCAVIVVTFLATRREPAAFASAAAALGYLVGRQALAPTGLHETALVLCAVGVYAVVGQLMISGPWFFAWACGLAVMGYHLTLYLLAYWIMGQAHFASWATALLVPSALATFALARLLHPAMQWLDRRLLQPRRGKELGWS